MAVCGCIVVAPAVATSPPTGATAQCRDGTYSYSQHRSGTCSHHGGVAKWLGGAVASGASAPHASVDLGRIVLLAARSRTSTCSLGAEPDRRCSPGAYYSGLTKQVICSAGFRTTSVRNVPQSEKYEVEVEYGLAPAHYGSALEIDHIVSLELGGSNDIANLFPEEASPPEGAPGFRVKDRLENVAHDWVCEGKISLLAAQEKIATNWEAFYRRVFGVAP